DRLFLFGEHILVLAGFVHGACRRRIFISRRTRRSRRNVETRQRLGPEKLLSWRRVDRRAQYFVENLSIVTPEISQRRCRSCAGLLSATRASDLNRLPIRMRPLRKMA